MLEDYNEKLRVKRKWKEITLHDAADRLSRICLGDSFDNMSDFERGEYDAVYLYEVRMGQSDEYYDGYGAEYARQQIADFWSTVNERRARHDENR